MSKCSPCCLNARELVQRARGIINDPEKVRWSDDALVDYLNEGLSLLQSMRPDSFTKTIELDLVPGSRQQVPEGVDKLLDVTSNVTATGGEGGPVNEADYALSRKITDTCSGGEDREVENYSVVSHDPKTFFVSPPVAAGTTRKVMARVVMDAPYTCALDIEGCIDVPRKHSAALVDWILHRAYLLDMESQYARLASSSAFERFYRVLDSSRLNEARHGSGYWDGEIGDGDPQTTPRTR